ncbi:MAG: septum formation initiator family protein [Hyphomicrobiales bacterium]|jgi:cell division protein FtsB
MLKRHKPRSRRTLYAFRVALVLFGIYFVYHAFHGDHGLLAYAQVQSQVEYLAGERQELEARRDILEARVEALRNDAMDGDLVDERARQSLALIGRAERIVRR